MHIYTYIIYLCVRSPFALLPIRKNICHSSQFTISVDPLTKVPMTMKCQMCLHVASVSCS